MASGYMFRRCLIGSLVLLKCVGAFDVDMAGGYPTECKLTPAGHEYAGSLNTTLSGYHCQDWNSNQPHYNYFTGEHDNFPEKSATVASNYCRNPDMNWGDGAWCYTTEPGKRWEACAVDLCECKMTKSGVHYEGRMNATRSRLDCQQWSSQSPHSHPYTSPATFPDQLLQDADNFCRNPNASRPDGPWCYTTSTDTEWQYCNISTCDMGVVTFAPPTVITTISGSTTSSTRLTTTSTSRPATPTTTHPATTIKTIGAGNMDPTKTPNSPVPTPTSGTMPTGITSGHHGGLSKTVVAVSVTIPILVLLGVGVAVVGVLYKRGFFKRFFNTQLEEEGFENPSYE